MFPAEDEQGEALLPVSALIPQTGVLLEAYLCHIFYMLGLFLFVNSLVKMAPN